MWPPCGDGKIDEDGSGYIVSKFTDAPCKRSTFVFPVRSLKAAMSRTDESVGRASNERADYGDFTPYLNSIMPHAMRSWIRNDQFVPWDPVRAAPRTGNVSLTVNSGIRTHNYSQQPSNNLSGPCFVVVVPSARGSRAEVAMTFIGVLSMSPLQSWQNDTQILHLGGDILQDSWYGRGFRATLRSVTMSKQHRPPFSL